MFRYYDDFRENLLQTNDEPTLNYYGKTYYFSYTATECYFNGQSDEESQVFNNYNELLDNAKIDGKLLSEVQDNVALSEGSEIKILFILNGIYNIFDEITYKIGIQPTKIIRHGDTGNEDYPGEWVYIAFDKDEDKYIDVYTKTDMFADLMVGKEDIINQIHKESIENLRTITPYILIVGDLYGYKKYFNLSPKFLNLAKNINVNILFYKQWNKKIFGFDI